MKSIRTNLRNHAPEGDERIRTADRVLGTPYRYDGPSGRLGYVYFVQEWACPDEPIKIGFSADPAGRLRLLRLKTGLHLDVLALLPAQLQTERDLHKRFAADRIRGEWFRPTEELRGVVELVNALHPLERKAAA